jgi:hypothetical protein
MVNSILHQHIQKLKGSGFLTTGYVLNNMFKDSPVYINERKIIYKRSIYAFFQEYCLVACHLLIPQIEIVNKIRA